MTATAWRRLACGALILLAAFAVVCAAEEVLTDQTGLPSNEPSALDEGADVVGAWDVEEVLDVAQGGVPRALERAGFQEIGQEELPASFKGEVACAFVGARCFQEPDSHVFGFLAEGGVQGASLASVWDARLKELGWSKVESGVAGVATYEKEEGDYRWMLVRAEEAGRQIGEGSDEILVTVVAS